jgi:DNA mismatch repair protein MutS
MNESLPLFDRAASPGQEKAVSAVAPDKLIDALDEIYPDALTPREALELLYRLKEMWAAKAGER